MKDDYLTYTPEDFAADEAFLRWQGGNDVALNERWEKWLEDHPEKKPEIQSAKALLSVLKFEDVLDESQQIDTKALWQRIEQQTGIEKRPINKRVNPLRVFWYAVPAAAIVLILIMIGLSQNDTVSVEAGYGEQITHVLPDKSTVVLNAASKITFEKDTWNDKRLLVLEGEAFFDVEKGSKFTVITQKGKVEVLGTRFNVYQRGGDWEVHCVEGKVAVTTGENEKQLVLMAGEMSNLTLEGHVGKQVFEKQQEVGWIEGKFRFVDAPLGRIFDEIERQYAVEIKTSQEIRAIKFQVVFDTSDLEATLHAVCWPNDLKYRLEGSSNTVEIYTEKVK